MSEGQRQRILIARALVKKASILILDEATSNLDSYNEKLIQQECNKTIFQHFKNVIFIAHRLSTLKSLDKIIVLENGKIIENGTHEQLLKLESEKYKNLWKLQSN